MNVENAWKMYVTAATGGRMAGNETIFSFILYRGYTGKNVVVTILDDGIQPNHPELAKNYVSLFASSCRHSDSN